MSTYTGSYYKTFFCTNCQSEKPIAKRVQQYRKVTCSDCETAVAQYKQTGVYTAISPYSARKTYVQDDDPVDIPQGVRECYLESITD